jgi:hypothetical protein
LSCTAVVDLDVLQAVKTVAAAAMAQAISRTFICFFIVGKLLQV